MKRVLLVEILLLSLGACKSVPKAQPKPHDIGWRPIGSWSGTGNTQTESFNIENTQWRIRWETTDETTPGAGSLLILVNSAVSGRPIALGVDHKGIGKGTAYVTEDPRLYQLVIESSGLKWSFSVEEAVPYDPPLK